ncbi:hypothetical protein MPLB_1750021 [Mesorhizobium sp. ORS 3324]|nr:hypothetical protein MPLB_1750021 [Mesorhizobium sp. ORS 3324]
MSPASVTLGAFTEMRVKQAVTDDQSRAHERFSAQWPPRQYHARSYTSENKGSAAPAPRLHLGQGW